MTFRFRTAYLKNEGSVEIGRYTDGTPAMRLVSKFGEPLSVPTVCLVDYGMKPAEGHVFIRDYSENIGMLQNLQDLGIIGPPLQSVKCGFGQAYECELLVKPGDEGVRAL